MATGLKSRILIRKKPTNPGTNYWAGTDWKLLIRTKTIPSPFGSPNMISTSTLEDVVETQEQGRRAAASMTVSGAWTKANKDALVLLEGEECDFLILYGTDGLGSEGIVSFQGTESFAPDEASDGHLTGSATISIHTTPNWIEDSYSVSVTTTDENGYPTAFTVAVKSSSNDGQ